MNDAILNVTCKAKLLSCKLTFVTILLNLTCKVTALERQDLSCTYLAHHELESVISIIVIKVNVVQAEPAHKEAVRGIAFSPSDLKFATCSDDSTIKASTGQLFV